MHHPQAQHHPLILVPSATLPILCQHPPGITSPAWCLIFPSMHVDCSVLESSPVLGEQDPQLGGQLMHPCPPPSPEPGRTASALLSRRSSTESGAVLAAGMSQGWENTIFRPHSRPRPRARSAAPAAPGLTGRGRQVQGGGCAQHGRPPMGRAGAGQGGAGSAAPGAKASLGQGPAAGEGLG